MNWPGKESQGRFQDKKSCLSILQGSKEQFLRYCSKMIGQSDGSCESTQRTVPRNMLWYKSLLYQFHEDLMNGLKVTAWKTKANEATDTWINRLTWKTSEIF